MKRSAKKETTFSVYHRAEFLYFVFNFSHSKSQIFKFGGLANAHKPLFKYLPSYLIYMLLLGLVILAIQLIGSSNFYDFYLKFAYH
jgi:hypothetical protein